MSVLAALSAKFGARILSVSTFRGDEEAIVSPADWVEVARWLRDAPDMQMNHFFDLTAVDYPEREPVTPRFDVILNVRSQVNNKRVRLKTRVNDGQDLETLVPVWRGADWTEREVYDMFGIRFRGHPDLRRILMYEEFVGFPLRKDYPIEKTQPLIPYRDVDGLEKLAPFGAAEGQPWGRVDWPERLAGRDLSTTPALAEQNAAPKTASTDVNKAGH